MSVQAPTTVSGHVSNVIAFPFKVVFGVLDGAGRGVYHGLYRTSVPDLKKAEKVYGAVRKPIHTLVASGLQDIIQPEGVTSTFGSFTRTMKSGGFGEAFGKLVEAFGKMRGPGYLMFGILGAALLSSVVLGWKGFQNTHYILDEQDRGHTAHIVKNKLFHVAKGIGFIGMIGGPLLCLTPIGAAAGLSLTVASAAITFGLKMAGELSNGFNMFNYPEKAGFVGRKAIRLFNEVTGRGN